MPKSGSKAKLKLCVDFNIPEHTGEVGETDFIGLITL